MIGQNQFAQIEVLPVGQAGKILGAKSFLLARKTAKCAAIVLLVCLLVAPIVIHFAATTEMEPGAKTLLRVITSLGLAVFFLLPLLFSQRNCWLRNIARKEIRQRPTKIVDPFGSGARFVEVVPTTRWPDASLAENATDVGFLIVDHQTNFLRFEGDNERYRIPAQAIIASRQDYYSRWKDTDGYRGETRFFFVVLTLQLPDQVREIPFRIRFGKNLVTRQQRSDANFELLKEIHQIQRAVGALPKPLKEAELADANI